MTLSREKRNSFKALNGGLIAQWLVSIAPTVVGMLLCSIFTVLRPLTRAESSSNYPTYSFLTLVIYILFAPVEKRIGAQIESLILNLIGMCVGIGWSQLALGAAVLAQHANSSTTAPARAIKAIFYSILAFSTGLAHAGSDRVRRAAKLANFLGAWILLDPVFIDALTSDYSLPFLYAALLAIASSTFAGLFVLPQTANRALSEAVVDYLREAQALLQSGIELYLLPADKTEADAYRRLQKSLAKKSHILVAAYTESVYEVSFARIGAEELRPLMAVARRLKSVFAAGLACHAHPMQSEKVSETEEDKDALRALGRAISSCFEKTAEVVAYSYRRKRRKVGPSDLDRERTELHLARKRFCVSLQTSLDVHVLHAKLGQSSLNAKRDLLRLAYFATSLLQVSYDADRCLTVAAFLLDAKHSHSRVFLPTFDKRLFSQREYISGVGELYAPDRGGGDDDKPIDSSHDADESIDFDDTETIGTHESDPHQASWLPKISYARRYQLWSMMSRIRRASSIPYAVKSCVGCTTLAIPSFLPFDSSGVAYWREWRGVWQVISFIFVLTFTTGDTTRTSLFRIGGTITGAAWALLIWVICRDNAEGLVVLMTLTAVPLTLMTQTRYAVVGIVFAVTIPPIAFAQYLGLQQSGESVPRIALERGVDVIIGIIVAVLITHLISPTYAHREFQTTVAKALEDISRFYMSLSRQNLRQEAVYTPIVRSRFEQHEAEMQRRVVRLRCLLDVQQLEFSLLPKPMRLSKHIIDSLEKMTELFVALRFIRIHLPRKVSVLEVRALRADLIAALHLSFFACASAFRSGRPLPQFLPSPRAALEKLANAVHAHLDLSPPRSATAQLMANEPRSLPAASVAASPTLVDPALSSVFALAEGEVLAETVDAMELLVDITRSFFGTQAFLDADDAVAVTPSAPSSPVPTSREAVVSFGDVVLVPSRG